MKSLEEKVKKSYFKSFIAKTAKFGLKMFFCLSLAYGYNYYSYEKVTERVNEYKEKVQEIRKDDDLNEFNFRRLFFENVPPEYVSELSDIKRKDGAPFYNEKGIIELHKHEVPADYVRKLHEFEKDSKGFDISDVFSSGEKTNSIRKLLEANSQLKAAEISLLWKNKVPIDYVKKILEIKNKFGDPVFNFESIAKFYEAGGTADYAKKLLEIKNNFGNPVLTGGDISSYKMSEKGLKTFKELIKNGKLEFPEYLKKSILECELREDDVDYISQMININKDEKGYPHFDPKSICFFRLFGGTVEYAKEIASIKDKDGKPKFNGQELYRFYQLDLKKADLEKFNDTEKPNAVIVYPTRDWNIVFEKNESIDFFQKLRKAYDVNVILASEENQAYKVIEDTPNIELLILAGHGSKDSLSLSDSDLRLFCSIKNHERYKIDKSDSELGQYLSKLENNATIFLLSCSNAEGGKEAENLANYIISLAEGKKVIASEKPFRFEDIKVNSFYPFDVKITYKSKDCTYSNK